SQTGTVTASSGTGNVVVDGVTLTASPGTAATMSTTINSNGFASGNTITITSTLTGTLTLTAGTPVAQVDQLTVGSSAPSPGNYVIVAGIEYEFEATGWTDSSVPSGTCYILDSGGRSNIVTYLDDAISFDGTH